MGVVYAAHDPELQRSVALKLLRPDRVTVDARARLAREARVMARLSHPNVVAVYDVGSDRAGDFIVMERIAGTDLRRWCAAGPRSLRALLDVFVAAGEGLEAAHRAGIVHGDFKPDNVLVGPNGDVHVGDFGLAALTDEPGELGGTLAYMAPEQLRGEGASPRSDQFAFAASLYETLCGTRPFVGRTPAERLAAIERAALERPAPDRTPPRWVLRLLSRALRADEHGRFPTVGALLSELKPAPARKRRWAVAAAVLATSGAALLATGTKSPVCAGRADAFNGIWDDGVRARVQAAFASAEAPYADDSLRTAFLQIDGYVATWRRAEREACEATQVRKEQSEELMAMRVACLQERRAELAAVTAKLSSADIGAVERAVEATAALVPIEACEDLERLRALDPRDRHETRARFDDLVARGEAARQLGHFEEAVTLAQDARALLEQGLAPDAVARAELLLGDVARERGDYKAAVSHFDEALASASARADLRMMTRVWLGLAEAQTRRNKHEDAERSLRQADALLERSQDASLMSERHRLKGGLLVARAEYEEAASTFEEGYLHARRTFGDASLEVARFSTDLARAYGSIAGRDEEALRWYRLSIELNAALRGPSHPAVATAHNNFGNYLRRKGHLAEAARHLETSLEIREQTLPETHPHFVSTLINLAIVRKDEAQYEGAFSLAERALEILARSREPDDYRIAAALLTLGEAKLEAGDPKRAVEVLDRAIEHRKRAVGSQHPHLGYDYWAKGRAEIALGKPIEARKSLEEARTQLGDKALAGEELARFQRDLDKAAQRHAPSTQVSSGPPHS
jgi:tetratricopeptide (TPR) repeat protein/predicted Ser/Thr protein kinase